MPPATRERCADQVKNLLSSNVTQSPERKVKCQYYFREKNKMMRDVDRRCTLKKQVYIYYAFGELGKEMCLFPIFQLL